MAVRDIYESGFDEDDGSVLNGRCPECKGIVRTESGETTCIECGLVVDEYRFDHAATPYDDDEVSAQQVGSPLTPSRHDRGLSSEIGYGGDARGNPLSAKKRAQISRFRMHHTQARFGSRREQNLAAACSEIARMTSALELSYGLREEASQLYRDAHTANLIRGRSIEMMAAGCVYAACRRRGQTRMLREVADVARCSLDDVRLASRTLSRELGLALPLLRTGDLLVKATTACNVPRRVEHRTRELLEIADESGISNGRSPTGVVAGCLYLAAQESNYPLKQTDIGRALDVTPTTIRARYQELVDTLNE